MNDANASNITNTRPDFLSLEATAILQARSDAYRKLVVRGGTSDFAKKLLGEVRTQDLFSIPIVNPQDASALLGGLWLWHDALDECHRIVQDLIGPTGSFWHAIMHRREGDFSNAKYWYARCEDHRAFRLVSAMAMDVIGRTTTDKSLLRIASGEFNPRAFVDLVEEIEGQIGDPRHEAAIRLQQMEWEALFHHCAYEATGVEGGMI